MELPHFPITETDLKNNASSMYLFVQDSLTVACGVFWTASYVLLIRQAYRDKSYGMPLIALCLNIAWELIYGYIYPVSIGITLAFLPWVFIDAFLVHATFKFGPSEWNNPLMERNWMSILSACLIIAAVTHVALIETVEHVGIAGFWAGYICQAILGISSISQLVSRDSTRGHSLEAFFCRWLGTFIAIAQCFWQYGFYPADYHFMASPMALVLYFLAEAADLSYYVAYTNIKQREKSKLT